MPVPLGELSAGALQGEPLGEGQPSESEGNRPETLHQISRHCPLPSRSWLTRCTRPSSPWREPSTSGQSSSSAPWPLALKPLLLEVELIARMWAVCFGRCHHCNRSNRLCVPERFDCLVLPPGRDSLLMILVLGHRGREFLVPR